MSLFAGDITNYSMNVNLRMGCDPGIGDRADCMRRSLNNGYEQVFLQPPATSSGCRNPACSRCWRSALIGLWGRTFRRRG